jgi:hypothetical protein
MYVLGNKRPQALMCDCIITPATKPFTQQTNFKKKSLEMQRLEKGRDELCRNEKKIKKE